MKKKTPIKKSMKKEMTAQEWLAIADEYIKAFERLKVWLSNTPDSHSDIRDLSASFQP